MLNKIKDFSKRKIEKFVEGQPKFVFTHVPKCAGSSLSISLLNGIYSNLVKNSPLTTGIDTKLAYKISNITGVNEQTVREIQLASYLASGRKVFVTGHCYASPKLVAEFKNDWKFITVLREPTERFISEFVYNTYKEQNWKKNTMDISEYISTDKMLKSGVTYARFFSGMSLEEILTDQKTAIERSVENLQNFYKIGFLNDLDSWITELNKELGFNIKVKNTNSSPNKDLVESIIADTVKVKRIRELCKVDLAIYESVNNNFCR